MFVYCRVAVKKPWTLPDEDHVFIHKLVPDQATCQSSGGPSMAFPCVIMLGLHKDGTYTEIYGDMGRGGKFRKFGDKLILSSSSPSGSVQPKEFIIKDKNTLIDPEGKEWNRWKGPGAWDFY